MKFSSPTFCPPLATTFGWCCRAAVTLIGLFTITASASEAAADKKIVSILLDLGRESECNHVENHLAIEAASEAARQRAAAAIWTLERLQQQHSSLLRIVDTCGNSRLSASRILSLAAEYGLINPMTTNLTGVVPVVNTTEFPEERCHGQFAGMYYTKDCSSNIMKWSWRPSKGCSS